MFLDRSQFCFLQCMCCIKWVFCCISKGQNSGSCIQNSFISDDINIRWYILKKTPSLQNNYPKMSLYVPCFSMGRKFPIFRYYWTYFFLMLNSAKHSICPADTGIPTIINTVFINKVYARLRWAEQTKMILSSVV